MVVRARSARRLVEEHCAGKRITEAVTVVQRASDELNGRPDPIVYACDALEFERALVGRVLERACRKGKQMWWVLGGPGKHPGLHFGMTGGIAVRGVSAPKNKRYGVDATEWPPRFTRLEVGFDDGTRLAFVNSRRIGRIRLLADPEHEPPVSLLGFDPFTAPPGAAAFQDLLRARRGAIKAVLLDQTFSAGVGNWIADEVCYQARVHPARPVAELSDDVIERVRVALVSIVQTACEARADHSLFPKEWLFHVRWSKGKRPGGEAPCTAEGHPIAFSTVGGRTTAVVAAVQGEHDWATTAKRQRATKPAAASTAAVAKAAKAVPARPKTAASSAATARAKPLASGGRRRKPTPPSSEQRPSDAKPLADPGKPHMGRVAARKRAPRPATADATPIAPTDTPSVGANVSFGSKVSADANVLSASASRARPSAASASPRAPRARKRGRTALQSAPAAAAAPAVAAARREDAPMAGSVAANRPKRACRSR